MLVKQMRATITLVVLVVLLFAQKSECFPAKYRKHHKHKRTHNFLNKGPKALHPSHRILTFLQKQSFLETWEDVQELKTYTTSFFDDIRKDDKAIPQTTFISLMEREQLFSKDDYSMVKKIMRENHVKAIQNEKVFAALMILAGVLLAEKAKETQAELTEEETELYDGSLVPI